MRLINFGLRLSPLRPRHISQASFDCVVRCKKSNAVDIWVSRPSAKTLPDPEADLGNDPDEMKLWRNVNTAISDTIPQSLQYFPLRYNSGPSRLILPDPRRTSKASVVPQARTWAVIPNNIYNTRITNPYNKSRKTTPKKNRFTRPGTRSTIVCIKLNFTIILQSNFFRLNF